MSVTFDNSGGFAIFCKSGIRSIGGSVKIEDKTKKPRQRSQKTSISYVTFEDMIKFTTDEFWITFLQNSAKGYFPRRYRFNGIHLMYKYRNTNDSIDITVGDLQTFQNLKKFLYDLSAIESPLDTQRKNLEKSIQKETTPDKENEIPWTKIKVSYQRVNLAIGGYISILKQKYNLTQGDYEVLFTAVKNIIAATIITDKDSFVCRNGYLVDIKGITYNPLTKKFEIDKNLPLPKEVNFSKARRNDFYTDTCTNYSEYSEN